MSKHSKEYMKRRRVKSKLKNVKKNHISAGGVMLGKLFHHRFRINNNNVQRPSRVELK